MDILTTIADNLKPIWSAILADIGRWLTNILVVLMGTVVSVISSLVFWISFLFFHARATWFVWFGGIATAAAAVLLFLIFRAFWNLAHM